MLGLDEAWPGEKEDEDQDTVVDRRDAQNATPVEGAVEVCGGAGTQEDGGDQEAGQDEEDVDAEPAVAECEVEGAGGDRGAEKVSHGVGVGEVVAEDEKEGEAADAVERGYVMAAGGVYGGCRRRRGKAQEGRARGRGRSGHSFGHRGDRALALAALVADLRCEQPLLGGRLGRKAVLRYGSAARCGKSSRRYGRGRYWTG